MSDREDSGDEEQTTALDIVVTKYNMTADIVNAVLKEVIAKCQPGEAIGSVCDFGDKLLTEKTAKVFKKEKELKKGIAFPTCISVNHCICHYSPLRSEPEVILKEDDVVKVDLGAHIDGFIATAAHTFVIGASKDKKVTGKKADVICAAYQAMEAAIRMLRPDLKHKNVDITETTGKIADAFHVKAVENMLSHQLLKNKIDGDKQIIQNPAEKQRQEMEKCEFENHDVFAIDILMSTGEGKARESDARTTVYKKDELIYQLKMKMSRVFLSEAEKRFGTMPFSLRAFEDEMKAKAGVLECERHGLMKPYQVFYERDGEFVAQFKATVLIMPNGLLKITGLPLDSEVYQSEHKVEDSKLVQLLQSSLKPSKKKSKKKDPAAGGDEKKENSAPAVQNGATPTKTPEKSAPKKKATPKKAA